MQRMPGGSELVSNRAEIVDLAVEHDQDLTVRRAHRLPPPGDVDNGEPTVSHDGAVAARLPMPVRASMAEGRVHSVKQRLIRQAIARLGVSENETAHEFDLSKTPAQQCCRPMYLRPLGCAA